MGISPMYIKHDLFFSFVFFSHSMTGPKDIPRLAAKLWHQKSPTREKNLFLGRYDEGEELHCDEKKNGPGYIRGSRAELAKHG